MRIAQEGMREPSLWPWSSFNATRPLAELLIDDEERCVALRARWKWLRTVNRLAGSPWMTPTRQRLPSEWEAPLDLVTAKPYGKWEMTRGVLLTSTDRPPAIFWCDTATQRAVLLAFSPR
jgi:hypothetical protein